MAGEGRFRESERVEAPLTPTLSPRKSGLPDLRIINAELGQARVRMRGEGEEAHCESTLMFAVFTTFAHFTMSFSR
jgi:hypothetical protein